MNSMRQKPKWFIPRDINKKKHSASLLELFFDLILVAFVGGFVHKADAIFKAATFDGFSFTFISLSLVSVLFTWKAYTTYASKFESLWNIRHRILTLLLMIGLSVITASMFIKYGSDIVLYKKVMVISTMGTGITFVTLFYMFLTTAVKSDNKYEKKSLFLSSSGIISAMVLWVPAFWVGMSGISRVLGQILPFLFWGAGLVSWFLFDIFSRSSKIAFNTRDISFSHLQERFGIIVIVFLGESMIQTIIESSKELATNMTSTMLILVSSVVLIFSWWWFFNDSTNYLDVINHPKRVTLYYYSMLGLLSSLSISAVGISSIIGNPDGQSGKMVLAIGLMLWAIWNALVFLSLKDFNVRDSVFVPSILRKFIYLGIVSISSFAWIGFTDLVSSSTFLFITTGASCLILGMFVLTFITERFHIGKKGESSACVVKRLAEEEEKWLVSHALKYADRDLHKKYDFKLNEYSKYLIDEKE